MKRFAFRLARLEWLRGVRRREARLALGHAVAEARDRRVERVRAERAVTEARATDPPAASDDSWTWKRYAEWREARRAGARAAAEREAEAERRADEAGRAYVEAARHHRALERLRELRHRRWRQAVEREEQKTLDETHLLRLGRERSETS